MAFTFQVYAEGSSACSIEVSALAGDVAGNLTWADLLVAGLPVKLQTEFNRCIAATNFRTKLAAGRFSLEIPSPTGSAVNATVAPLLTADPLNNATNAIAFTKTGGTALAALPIKLALVHSLVR